MFFFSFLFFITLYVLSCFLLCIWMVAFPCTARDRDWEKLSLQCTRNRWKWHLFYKGDRKSLEHVHCSSKTGMDSFRRPKVMADRESENQVRKWKGPSPFVLIEWWFFFLSISLFSSNVDKLWTFFVCLKTERDHMFHMFRPGLAAKSLVIDAFVTIHLDL